MERYVVRRTAGGRRNCVVLPENAGITPRSALDALQAGRPMLPGYGRTLKLLPGTPTVV